MRSVVVVFPASMCAIMPIFLQRSNGTVLGTTNSFWAPNSAVSSQPSAFSFINLCHPGRRTLPRRICFFLPPVVCKRLICFRHAVHIFLLLDGGSTAVGRVEQLIAQLVDHPFLAPRPRITNNPADGQRRPAVRIDLDRHLIVRTTNAAGLHFEQRLRILDGFLEQLDGLVATL